MPVILVTEPIADRGLDLLARFGDLRIPWAENRSFNDGDLMEASAIIVRLVPVTAAVIGKAPNLKVIGRHGAGLDTVDLDAATLRQIPVVYTPSATANAVAEHVFHLMLGLARHTVAGDRAVRESHFEQRNSLVGFELRNKTLGIVGLGAIGLRVAELGHRGFGMEVVGYDPFATPPITHNFVKRADSLRELLQQANVVTLHLPLTSQTRHAMNAQSIGWMKKSALLINTARGGVVDTHALINALRKGELAGAALDVFEEEPLPRNHPLQSMAQVLLSPHLAGSTVEAQEAMGELVARQVLQVLKGEWPEFIANPEVLQSRLA